MKTDKLFITIILAQLFVVGGMIQSFGLLSVTYSNIIIVLEILLYLLLTRTSPLLINMPLLILFLYILLIGMISKITYIVSYELFVIFPYFSLLFGMKVIAKNEFNIKFVYNFFMLLIFVQIPIVLAQSLFAETIAGYMANISAIDIVFGTFYMKSDSTLSLFAILLSTHILFIKLAKKTKLDYLVLLASFVIVLTANSKTNFIIYIFMLTMYLFSRIKKTKFPITSMFLFLLPIIVFTFFHELYNYYEKLNDIYYTSSSLAAKGLDVNRLYVLLTIMFDEISFFGNGLYEYYNYVTKEWKYFGGHSLVYSIYIDIGLFGLLLSFLFLFFLISKHIRYSLIGFVYFIEVMFFSLFNVTFLDLGVIILFIYFSNILPNYQIKKGQSI